MLYLNWFQSIVIFDAHRYTLHTYGIFGMQTDIIVLIVGPCIIVVTCHCFPRFSLQFVVCLFVTNRTAKNKIRDSFRDRTWCPIFEGFLEYFHALGHRELELDGATGDFAEPLWRLKTGHFTTYTVLSFEAS